ncbi:MAG: transposase domain-containing protein [Oliverpabstia sp.]
MFPVQECPMIFHLWITLLKKYKWHEIYIPWSFFTAERRAKSYATSSHNTVDGANASAIVMSIIETAKANNLNIYQYLYTLLLYMPDYKNEPAGIKQLMPWSEFIKENCSGITDTEKILPEKRGDLPM